MSAEPDPTLNPANADLIARLEAARVLPAPAFRGALRRRLEGAPPQMAPARLRRLVSAYALSGALLLGAAGASVAGVGPLAASHADASQARAHPAAHAGA